MVIDSIPNKQLIIPITHPITSQQLKAPINLGVFKHFIQIERNKSLWLIGPHGVRNPLLESGDPRVDPAAPAQIPEADNARDVPLASGTYH